MIPVCRKILGREPRCPEWTTIGIAAAIAAGVGGAAAGITSLVNGVYPWEDPLKFMKSEAIGIGTGAVGGALGGAAGVALGPLLGAGSGAATGGGVGAAGGAGSGGAGGAAAGAGAGFGAAGGGAAGGGAGGGFGAAAAGGAEALGVGTGTGTIAAEAGAAVPQNLGGMVSQSAGQVLSGGTQATEAAIGNTVQNLGGSFVDQGLSNALRAAPKNIIGGALQGAMKDYEHPLRGLATGAVGGLASSAVNVGTGALMRGQTAGLWNTTPVKQVEFASYNPDAPAYSLARDEILNPTRGFSMQTSVAQPGMGGRLVGAAGGLGSRFAGGVAQMGVRSAMTPQPTVPPANPYSQWGNNYLSRYNA